MTEHGTAMTIEVAPARWAEVLPLRELRRREMNAQLTHDSFPRRGLSDPYLIRVGGRLAGYASVANTYWKGAVDEFHTMPAYRAQALAMFRALLAASGATHVRAQSNDRLMLLALHDCAKANIAVDAVLFEDGFTTDLPNPGGAGAEGILREVTGEVQATFFPGAAEDAPHWMVEHGGVAVAWGGVLSHYNPPFGDLYFEVAEAHRRRGWASWFVQELKRIAYEHGKVPAARCSPANVGSRRSMQKAGMLPVGHILVGEVVDGTGIWSDRPVRGSHG